MNSRKPLHVCHLVFRFDVGGLERVLLNCVQKMPVSDYQHSIIALTDIGAFASQLPDNVTTFALHKQKGKDWSLYKKLYQLLRQLKPDVFHSYNLATIEYHPVALLAGIKRRIHAEHGRDIYDPSGSNKKYQWLRRLLSPFIHRIIAVSDELNQWMLHTVKLSAAKVKLVYNGIDTDYFTPTAEPPACAKLQIGTVARLSPIKDQATLLSAFAALKAQSPELAVQCELLIAGDGELMPSLQQQAKDLRIEKSVRFLGHQENMKPLYQSFSLFTLSSLAEGIPMTVLEAMACGLPIVATDVGGLPELVSTNGQLVPPRAPAAMAEAWYRLLSDKPACQLASEASRQRVVDNFSEQQMLRQYQQIYQGEM